MNDEDFYYTLDSPGTASFKDRGSLFIGYAYPLPDTVTFKELLNAAKKEHPKATHHCFAYLLGADGENFRLSDDGEPSGTAGKQIMNQLQSKQLVNVLVIVVRYFGGTLLGVPGLINAYKTAAALALQMTPVVRRIKEKQYELQFDYTQLNSVMTVIKYANCRIIKQEIQLFCKMEIAIPVNRIDEMIYRFGELRDVSLVRM